MGEREETTMAKSAFPMKTGSGLLGKVVGTLAVLAVLTLVVRHPNNAATFVTGAFHLAGQAIDGFSAFLGQIIK
jgi:hypothetical protein